MKTRDKPEAVSKVFDFAKKYKYVLLVLLLGLILLLIPTGKSAARPEAASPSPAEAFSLEEQEERIARALSQIEGAGRVTVVLTLQSGMERVYARDEAYSKSTSKSGDKEETDLERESKAVLVSGGSGTEKPVTVKSIYPVYQGALVVCDGADRADVRLAVIRAVAGLTGLSTDKIVVAKMSK